MLIANIAKASSICTVTIQATKLVDTTIDPSHPWKPTSNKLNTLKQLSAYWFSNS
jgi:hypothetical protein